MIEIYKIKIIRKDTNTQDKKKVYESKAKFMKYGKDMFNRHHNKTFYYNNKQGLYCEIYQMSDDSKWTRIGIPMEFMTESEDER